MFLPPFYLDKRDLYVLRKPFCREIFFKKYEVVVRSNVHWLEGDLEGKLTRKELFRVRTRRMSRVDGSRSAIYCTEWYYLFLMDFSSRSLPGYGLSFCRKVPGISSDTCWVVGEIIRWESDKFFFHERHLVVIEEH